MKHFAAQTGVSKVTQALLIIDNHSSHVNIDAVNFACENGIVLLTIWPNTMPKMQPLDVSVYGPFKNFYDKALDSWMRSHPGERFTIYHVATAVNEAFLSAMTPRNITSGFKATGIWPYNPNIFTDNDFLLCLLEEEKDDLEQTEDPRYSYRIERSTDQDAAQPGLVSGLRNWLNSDQTNDMRVSFEEAEIILEPPSAYVTITSASMPTGEAEDIPGTSSSHDTAPRPSMFSQEAEDIPGTPSAHDTAPHPSMFSQEAEDIPGTSSAHDAIPHPFTCSQEAEDIPGALSAHTTSRPSMYSQEAADNNPGTSSVHLTTPRRYLPFQKVGNTQETPNPSSSIAATANTPNETPSNNKILAACSSIHVSPEEIVPMPQVTRRKKVGVSRQGSSKILTATPEKARLEELAKKRKKQTNTKSRPALMKKVKKVKDSRPKSKNNPGQTKSYTGTKRRLNLRDDKSSSEDKEEALVLSMRHNFETNTSDDNCEEFDTHLPLQPQGEVRKCCFCGENYEDSRSGEQWVRCTRPSVA